MSKTTTHKAALLKAMLRNIWITASDVNISNANQYLIELRKAGICDSYWIRSKHSRYKQTCIIDFRKAKEFIAKAQKR
jgi:hypothetical protein